MNFNVEVKVEAEEVLGDTNEDNKENIDLYENHVKLEDVVIGPETFHKPHFTETSTKDPSCDFDVEVKVEKDYSPTKADTETPKKVNAKNEKPNPVCKLCQKVFLWKHNLIRHIKVHDGGRQFTCHLCPKRFTAKWNLSQHLRIHNNLKYECRICGACITDHSRYNRHLREHGRKEPKVKTVGTVKLFCDICGKCYVDRRNLVRHVQGHYEENRYKCHLCTKSYMRSDKLNQHMRSHTTVKPCVVCGKQFLKRVLAKRHEERCLGD